MATVMSRLQRFLFEHDRSWAMPQAFAFRAPFALELNLAIQTSTYSIRPVSFNASPNYVMIPQINLQLFSEENQEHAF